MRRRSQRTTLLMAALALASGALVACSLLTGLDADYSSSAHDGAVTPSGEAGGSDAPGSDGGGMEGSMTDGMVTPDADAAALSFCKTQQGASENVDFFCADFESSNWPGDGTPPAPWLTLTNARDAGTFTFVPDAGTTRSKVLDVVGLSNGGGGAHAFLRTALSSSMGAKPANQYQKYVLKFEFRVLSSNLDYDALGLLIFKPNDQTGENGIAGYGPGTPHVLSHQGTGVSPVKRVTDTIPTDWHAATVTLTRVGAGPTYTRAIIIDMTDVEEGTSPITIDTASPTELWVGVFNADTNPGAAHAQFDNVVLVRTP
jgi:hypothetical protein